MVSVWILTQSYFKITLIQIEIISYLLLLITIQASIFTHVNFEQIIIFFIDISKKLLTSLKFLSEIFHDTHRMKSNIWKSKLDSWFFFIKFVFDNHLILSWYWRINQLVSSFLFWSYLIFKNYLGFLTIVKEFSSF